MNSVPHSIDNNGIIQYESRMTGLQPSYYRTYKSDVYEHISEGVINN